MKKCAASHTIIAGSDGPTSVFLLGGRERNIFKRIHQNIRIWRHRHKQALVKKRITVGTHTLAETIQYMITQYDAKEADTSNLDYTDRKRALRISLIQREQPALLGDLPIISPPKDFSDEQAVKEWMHLLDENSAILMQRAEGISEEIFPTDYHMFLIDRGEQGTLQLELDLIHPLLQSSYSGDKAIMEAILQDIMLYYGVSLEDIDQQTDRYLTLLTCLSQ